MSLFRQLAIVLLLAAVAGGGFWWYRTAEAPAVADGDGEGRRARMVAVEAVRAETRSLEVSVEAVGTTRALRSVDLVPLAEGRIEEIAVVAGAEVGAGAVIARLDDAIERATLAEAEARLSERRRSMERAEALRRSATISEANFETLRSERAIAEAEVERARRRLADRTIRAPFPGVLGITSIAPGARVDTDTVIATLDDLSGVEIEFRLPETVYGQILAGQRVTATGAAFPGRTFAGEVVAIDSRVDPVSRAFRVRARLPNPDRALPVGMFMRLDLRLAAREGVVVPEEAVVVEGGAAFVYLVEGERAVRRGVATGARREGMVEIVKGVAAGEVVIHRGVQSLRDGIAVRLVGEPPADGPVPETAASDRPRQRS